MSKASGGVIPPIMALAVVAALGACAETKQVAMKEPAPASAALPDPDCFREGRSRAK